MPFDQLFTTARGTEADEGSVRRSLQALDASASVIHNVATPTYLVGKATAWTGPQIAAAQTVIDTAPVVTVQLMAQSTIEHWPLDLKAAFVLVMEQMNVVRAALPVPLPPFTTTQFLDAIRAKAATL